VHVEHGPPTNTASAVWPVSLEWRPLLCPRMVVLEVALRSGLSGRGPFAVSIVLTTSSARRTAAQPPAVRAGESPPGDCTGSGHPSAVESRVAEYTKSCLQRTGAQNSTSRLTRLGLCALSESSSRCTAGKGERAMAEFRLNVAAYRRSPTRRKTNVRSTRKPDSPPPPSHPSHHPLTLPPDRLPPERAGAFL